MSASGVIYDRTRTEHFNVSFDGTFRLCSENFVLLTCGVLLKDLSRDGKYGPVVGHPTGFQELIFCLTNRENHRAYGEMVLALAEAFSKMYGINIRNIVQQVHGDQHPGLEKMRKD
jgi:hypothetical protein